MRRSLSFIAAGLLTLLTLPLAAQESPLPARDGVPAFRLGPRVEAEAAFKALSSLSFSERKELYARIDPDLYPALWSIQFERFSAAHPELSGEQRALIARLLDFVNSGIFDVPRERADWEFRVHAPLTFLATEATRLLGAAAARELLTQIGAPTPAPADGYLRAGDRNTIATNNNCDCVVGSIDCGEVSSCVGRPTVHCTFYPFCGPMFMTACDGLCQ